ncbi:MAG: UDP-N-acetylglucosamine 2-epimerase [Candidatus Saccharimonadales bacterium]
MAPIMLECEKRDLSWRWIYTAQHRDTIQQSLDTFGLPSPDHTVFDWDTEANTIKKMWYWFIRLIFSLFRGRKILDGYTGKENIVLTHGDTLTTWWGALLGRLYGCRVMHVEAGLRSFNIFKPFPEEINRLITFRLSNYYACPGEWAVNNLAKYKGEKINTYQNTQLDTLRFGLENSDKSDLTLPSEKYVVVSIHRYENLFNKDRFSEIINRLEEVSKSFVVLFVQHPATQAQIEKLGLKNRLLGIENIKLLPRLEYLDFIKAIKHSEFVITDGGGNQEELYHMGKPTLIFRNETERQEGLGETAVVSKLDPEIIRDFIKNYKEYEQKGVLDEVSPSKIIVDQLVGIMD